MKGTGWGVIDCCRSQSACWESTVLSENRIEVVRRAARSTSGGAQRKERKVNVNLKILNINMCTYMSYLSYRCSQLRLNPSLSSAPLVNVANSAKLLYRIVLKKEQKLV